MAEGLARKILGPQHTVTSAGSKPSVINPYAVEVLAEIGLDISKSTSKSVETIDLAAIDLIVTLCAEEVCPIVPGKTKRLHWLLPDPAGRGHDADEKRRFFRAARDEIAKRLEGMKTEFERGLTVSGVGRLSGNAALQPPVNIADTQAWVRRAVALSWFTIVYNFIEGVVSMWFGVADDSFALFGFGADSFIEVASAALVLWRFRAEIGAAPKSVEREKHATLGIGVLFLLLTLGTAGGASYQLWTGTNPDTTIPGLVVAAISLSFMFFLWKAKVRVAENLGSSAMKSDASCSLACIKLSAILFAGSMLFLLFPVLWWADSVAALALAGMIGKEGWEIFDSARKGEVASCCGGGCH